MRRALLIVMLAWAGRAGAAPKAKQAPPVAAAVGGLPGFPDGAPAYGEKEFLEDSMASMSLAVVGTPHGGELRIQRVVAGTPAAELVVRPKVVRIVGPRFSAKAGLWLLVRATAGYYALNPTAAPLPEATWKSLAVLLPAVLGKDLVVEDRGDGVSIDLGEHMSEVLTRQFDAAGNLTLLHRAPKRGPGLWFTVGHGRLRDFSRTLDGELDGLERDYDDQGRPRSESTWRRGLRNGPTRAWKDGQLTRDVVFEDNLERPVVHWTGKPGPVVLERHEVYNVYKAPAALRDRLKVGLTTAQVLALLQVDFSLPQGLDLEYSCGQDLHIGFQDGRVSEVARKSNGTICDP